MPVLIMPGITTLTPTGASIAASSPAQARRRSRAPRAWPRCRGRAGDRDHRGHRRGVHDVALLARRQDARHERMDAVDDAPEVRRRSRGATPTSGSSHELPPLTMPALFTRDVQLTEAVDRGVGRARSIASGSGTSTTSARTSAPRRGQPGRVRAEVRFVDGRSWYPHACGTNASVVASPIPLAAPVTTALRSSNWSIPADQLPLGVRVCVRPRKR